MSKSICLTASHNVFLTKEERYRLVNRESVRVVGCSVPVWLHRNGKTDEPAEEIFCWYELYPGDEFELKPLSDGYALYLSPSMRESLRDIADQGSEFTMFTYHGRVEVKGKPYPTLHFVSIQDKSVLLKSLS